MGKVPTEDPDAYVVYLEQKRDYKLYNIKSTRVRKPQRHNGFPLTRLDYTIHEILAKRKK